jgi:asparagine synthase (glutamine-hydrolysing)
MCGIVGFYFAGGALGAPEKNKLLTMVEALNHRGPDASGIYCNKNVGLGHTRLSIHDLSSAGDQPMLSLCGEYALVFNGEIYNFLSIKKDLLDSVNMDFRGHSDTEVLLNALIYWGVESTLKRINGMFAFAFYDFKLDKVHLARDRFGEKPLYVYSSNTSFAFSSEIKPLEVFTKNLSVNDSSVNSQLQYGYIPAPFSIYNEIFKLQAGHYLTISLPSYKKLGYSDSIAYWEMQSVVEEALRDRKQCQTLEDALNISEKLLKSSVKQRMASDVDLGVFLSGGLDSTCIAALMQSQSAKKVKTFSIGFHDEHYNEAQHAKVIAERLGTDHHELYIDPKDMIDIVPQLSSIYDEPFSDSSQLPTLMLSRFAKQHVTVALTGDAGDEVFCGYNRYSWGKKLVDNYSSVPSSIRQVAGDTVRLVPPLIYNKMWAALAKLIPKLKAHKSVGDKLHKLAYVIGFNSESDLYRKLTIVWPEIALTSEVIDIATSIKDAFSFEGLELAERMMWQDAIGYMQNDILTKVDRASMASSLETRVPFLDNDVFKFAWSLPLDFKFYRNQTKYPLRHIISKHIPDEVMNRPKSGFGVPIYNWLRNELKDWAEDLLSEKNLAASGLLDVILIRSVWKIHLSGRKNLQYPLWNVLMFQQWYLGRNS